MFLASQTGPSWIQWVGCENNPEAEIFNDSTARSYGVLKVWVSFGSTRAPRPRRSSRGDDRQWRFPQLERVALHGCIVERMLRRPPVVAQHPQDVGSAPSSKTSLFSFVAV